MNDYIAKGGSGFAVLKRNTTRIETGISLRDSLIGYMEAFCNCDEILAGDTDDNGNLIGKKRQLCGNLVNRKWTVDDQVRTYCETARTFKRQLDETMQGACSCRQVLAGDASACAVPEVTPELRNACVSQLPPGPALGRCSCLDALSGNPVCGNVTQQLRSFCENPTAMPVAIGVEDGRIARRVK